ncbi:pyruvate, phosphate dikinase [Vagococcus fluvialis]|uniref:Pyruvate, phosphate dikinase n=1 Tax=Vagococcus fluvialis TaxID=2738 RepID=A0A369B1D9_9ENTE|nr:pyruvate, phosphate dikinase [Vagococcus fluvialis]MBO0442172.1 pyruvate, phosphate dikinase [Vagococcus fluvialis]MBO0480149.1 pyruvate, phosphate dikinase [Vagococcus fluvialis]MBO0483914.1 pyruvate, phosphate dikinase [Vagococcus fluvialis]RCX14227.1 pyruvate phosphate dikinase [Vagococcus fluvialis]RSU02811.1 pyruvate, phosphate dikinase [Vagococcus fluvialis]
MTKRVYRFKEGNAEMKEILGGKGANLAEMTRLGLPVPDGFTISTEACMDYLNNGHSFTTELKKEIEKYLEQLEVSSGKSFDDPENIMLLSVRSGAKFSMPGMMDTVLNLGLNDENVEHLAKITNDEAFAYDCYRRLLQMFGDVVFGIDTSHFENFLGFYKQKNGVLVDSDLTAEQLKEIVVEYKRLYLEIKKQEFPQDPREQLFAAVEAVFSSWNNERAIFYRQLHNIPHDLGTAVNIQLMVFGNSGEESGTGVAFTRNPSTGENKLFGEYLINAQGEDVVAGIRTPQPISNLHETMPKVYDEFVEMSELLEKHYKDMQDIEFTIENKKLYLLQTRNGKRTAHSAFKIAVDLVNEGLKTKEEAIMSLDAQSVNQLLHPVFVEEALAKANVISKVGLPASPGSATGRICFDAATAKEWVDRGEKVVLVRQETSPEDIGGMVVSEAIVTSRGGMTSHAAVVARGMGTCCVAGCSELEIDEFLKVIKYPNGTLTEGDIISVDGTNGDLYVGEVELTLSEKNEDFETVMAWTKEIARLEVRMNAETSSDIKTGIAFDASGIGLARTEHMFFAPERLIEMRRFILSDSTLTRKEALETILSYQIEDFKSIFSTIEEKSVVVRLLDPPLHEFVPSKKEDVERVAKEMDMKYPVLQQRINELHEVNPMLGHRGCRLAITYPELYLMQAEAIIRSAISMKEEKNIDVNPEIMIPLVGMKGELTVLKEKITSHIESILQEEKATISYTLGTMIELPRACLIADELVKDADFFSFGTNDLTQMTYGFSRDDAAKYINQYVADGILPVDPFQTIDVDGVGELITVAVKKARTIKPKMKIGVCGELGGDPESILFFDKLGLDYVSCSPYRVPVAYIAAAQSAIQLKK